MTDEYKPPKKIIITNQPTCHDVNDTEVNSKTDIPTEVSIALVAVGAALLAAPHFSGVDDNLCMAPWWGSLRRHNPMPD